MAYPRSSSTHACIHVSPWQTLLLMISAVVLLLASMLSSSVAVAVAAAEPPPGGYRFGLTHVDAHGNVTKEELIRRAAERSRLRSRRGAATTSAALLGDTSTTGHGGASTTAKLSNVHYSENEYLMEVQVKGESQKYEALVDTGSSLIWLKPPKSVWSWSIHSVRQVFRYGISCNDDLCASKASTCDRSGSGCWFPKIFGCSDICSYKMKYGDGVISSGPMYRETLWFLSQGHLQDGYVPVDNIAMVWSKETKCDTKRPGCHDLEKYDGTVGLGRGEQSLVKQLNVHNLSYCLTTYDTPNLSPLLLGSPNALKDSCAIPNDGRCKVQATSLLPHRSRYYVNLEYIEIGGKSTKLPKTANMFIDSGASFTVLEKTAHEALLDHVNKAMHKNATKVQSAFCWTNQTDLPEFPDLELHFAGGAVMYLHKDKVLYKDEPDEDGLRRVCMAIEAAGPKDGIMGSVLGNFQQQNIHMHFDVANNKLSFVNVDNCSTSA